MGSETFKLPTIDFSESKLEAGSPAWDSVKEQVMFALENYGCFEATFDKIPRNLRESVMDELKQLFDLPLETKLRNTSDKPYHGYVGQYSLIPLYESLGIDEALEPGNLEKFTNLMWPQGNPQFRDSMYSFSEKLSELDQVVRRMVIESLGLEKYMDEHMDSTVYLLRVQKYDSPKSHEAKLGLTSHTDKNIVTILYQNEVNGLEVLTKDGQWIAALSDPNSFIVFAGDGFHAWTNGRIYSSHHRVMMTGDVDRYSIGLFSTPKEGYMIQVPEEMVDERHPLLFKPHDPVKLLANYYPVPGQESQHTLKDLCGA